MGNQSNSDEVANLTLQELVRKKEEKKDDTNKDNEKDDDENPTRSPASFQTTLTHINETQFGVSADVVDKLTITLPENKNDKVFSGNFFTNISLIEHLK